MEALAPDNMVKGLAMKIRASAQGKRLRVVITGCERVETLEATVQDVFRCIRAAEMSISATSSGTQDQASP
jgi:hypothetical protein